MEDARCKGPRRDAAPYPDQGRTPDPEMRSLGAGAWNYLLKVRLKNTKELESFLSGTIKAVRGVERTETMITLSTAKETWALAAE
jgi:DNA-binding Lrp family transcriptional regulator